MRSPWTKWLLFLLLPLIPFFFSLSYLYSLHTHFVTLHEQLNFAEEKALQLEMRKKEYADYLALLKKRDPFFLAKQLETLTFLGDNHLRFIEGPMQINEGIRQSEFHLSHPVEMNDADLRHLLSLLEGRPKGSPDLILKEFSLHKKTASLHDRVYLIDFQLIKKE